MCDLWSLERAQKVSSRLPIQGDVVPEQGRKQRHVGPLLLVGHLRARPPAQPPKAFI